MAVYVGISKMIGYESPYSVTGAVQHTGLKDNLRIYEQIEISERGKTETWSDCPQ